MGTQSVQMKEVLSWLVRWARHAGTRDFYPALAALVSPVQNISPYTIFNLCIPIAQQPGQACSRAGPPMSLNVRLCLYPYRCLSPLYVTSLLNIFT